MTLKDLMEVLHQGGKSHHHEDEERAEVEAAPWSWSQMGVKFMLEASEFCLDYSLGGVRFSSLS